MVEKLANIKIQIWAFFLALSWPWKITIYTVLGSNIAVISAEYSTYFYCFWIGIRPPVEGIAHLSLFVGLISLVLTLSTLAAVAFAYFLLKLSNWFAKKLKQEIIQETMSSIEKDMLSDERAAGQSRMAAALKKLNYVTENGTAEEQFIAKEEFENLKKARKIELNSETKLLVIKSILWVGGLFIAIIFAWFVDLWVKQYNVADEFNEFTNYFFMLLFILGLFIIFFTNTPITKWMVKKHSLLYVATGGTLFMYFVLIAALFIPAFQGALLQRIKFGGFANVVIVENTDHGEVKHSCQLVIRSVDYLVCYFPAKEDFEEIPLAHVQKLSFKR